MTTSLQPVVVVNPYRVGFFFFNGGYDVESSTSLVKKPPLLPVVRESVFPRLLYSFGEDEEIQFGKETNE
jgi:hypothetical protein